MSKKENKSPISAIQILQQTAEQMIDELSVPNETEEKKREILERITNLIDDTIKKFKNNELSIREFTKNEKIELLEKTKLAVQEFLIHILSSSNPSAKSYEALALLIKVNAELIRNIEETEGVISVQNGHVVQQKPTGDSNQSIIIAPSEKMLEKIIELRHKKKQDIPATDS